MQEDHGGDNRVGGKGTPLAELKATDAAAAACRSDVPTPDSAHHAGLGSSQARRIEIGSAPLREPRRHRDKEHLKFVASRACLICGREPSDPHHLRFTQPSALGRKVSDEFTVPLCRTHHREVHRCQQEAKWWSGFGLDPLSIAATLWDQTRPHRQGVPRGNPEPAMRSGAAIPDAGRVATPLARGQNHKTKPIPKAGPA